MNVPTTCARSSARCVQQLLLGRRACAGRAPRPTLRCATTTNTHRKSCAPIANRPIWTLTAVSGRGSLYSYQNHHDGTANNPCAARAAGSSAPCPSRCAAARRRRRPRFGTLKLAIFAFSARDQRVGVERRARRAATTTATTRLAEVGVRHADHGALGDAGQLVEHALDLGRVDVVAAADDEVLAAADDA